MVTTKKKGIGPGRSHLNANVTSEKYEYIKGRSSAIKPHCTLAVYGGLIIDYWLSHGAPSLADGDKVTPVPEFPERPRYSRGGG